MRKHISAKKIQTTRTPPTKIPNETEDNLTASHDPSAEALSWATAAHDSPIDTGSLTPRAMAHLQRTIGNRAVTTLINRQAAAAPKNQIQRGIFGDISNAIGDALDSRDNEAALDLWEEYKTARSAMRDFSAEEHAATNFQSSTKIGFFDAAYDAKAGQVTITCRCKFSFVNGTATEFPAAVPADLAWEDAAKEAWKTNFLTTCSTKWSGNHTFYCQKKWWESLKAKVKINFIASDDKPHFALTIKKIPVGGFSRSSVTSPVKNAKGEFSQGTGDFDSEDLTTVNKPGGRQQAAVHESGHMMGLDDEYETGEAGAPSHSGMVQSEFGHGVARGADGRIMSGGSDIKPEHGVTFLEALKKATNMPDWSATEKEATPVPPNPATMNMGDFPENNSDTRMA